MRWLLVLGLAGLAACSSGAGTPRAERALPEPITVSSPAFPAGAAIPQRLTRDGDNRSPPLAWSGVPPGTVELAVVVDDPDAPRGTYVHWVVVFTPSTPSGAGLRLALTPARKRRSRPSRRRPRPAAV
jgi:hypothetical protein